MAREVVTIEIVAKDKASGVTSKYTRRITEADKATKKASASSSRFSSVLSGALSGSMSTAAASAVRFGGGLSLLVGGLFLAKKAADALVMGIRKLGQAFVGSLRSGIAFERRIAEILTISERAEFPVQRLKKSILGLAATFGQSIGDTARATYQAISAGATTAAEANAILEASGKLAVGGLTTLFSAVDSLTSVLNAYSLTSLTATEAADNMFTSVRFGKTTVSELSGQLGNVVSFAAQAGLSFGELNAALTTLTLRGIKTEKATIQIRQAMAQIIKPTKVARDEARRLGIHFDTLAVRQKGFVGLLKEIQSSSKFTAGTFAKLFGNVRALNSVLALTIDGGEEFSQQLENQATGAGAASDAFATMSQTTDFLLQKISTLGSGLSTTFGTLISESQPLKEVLEGIIKVMEEMQRQTESADFQQIVSGFVRDTLLWGADLIEALENIVAGVRWYVSTAGSIMKMVRNPAGAAFDFAMEQTPKTLDYLKGHAQVASGQMTMAELFESRRDRSPKSGAQRAADFLREKANIVTGDVGPMLPVGGEQGPSVDVFEQIKADRKLAADRKKINDAIIASEKAARKARVAAENKAAAAAQARLDKMVASEEAAWRRITASRERAARKAFLNSKINAAIASKSIERMKREVVASRARAMALVQHQEMIIRKREEAMARMRAAAGAGQAGGVEAAQGELQELRRQSQQVTSMLVEEEGIRNKLIRAVRQQATQELRQDVREQVAAYRLAAQTIGGFAEMIIQNYDNAGDMVKALTTHLVRSAERMMTTYIQLAAAKKAKDTADVMGSAAVGGAAVGADVASKSGVFALAIAPPLIAAFVGIITGLLSTFHEGGTMGRGGQRAPLNLGPSEHLALLRDGEAVIPSAKMSGAGGGSGGGTSVVNMNLGFLSDPSRASFSRVIDDDVVGAMNNSLGARRITLNDRRTFRRNRS